MDEPKKTKLNANDYLVDHHFYENQVRKSEEDKLHDKLLCPANHTAMSSFIEKVVSEADPDLYILFHCKKCKAVLGSEKWANHYYDNKEL